MKLHLVGGFLGSGKTTAIINAAHVLLNQGVKVGIITNDQGKYLVDTAFFRLADIPATEVSGGCFCCNYDDLDLRLEQLIQTLHPEVIFAESVGSCADIVSTVVKPLLALRNDSAKPNSFSVFCDVRMLRRRLSGQEMPFSDDIVYIFDKQVEEAGLVILNKMDLLTIPAQDEVQTQLLQKYPGKPYLFQSSLSSEGVKPWLEIIQSGPLALTPAILDIDYARYGKGEAKLAWLDMELSMSFPEAQGKYLLQDACKFLLSELSSRKAAIGHLKFLVYGFNSGAEEGSFKISFTTLPEPGWETLIPDFPGHEIQLLVNARVEMPAEELRHLVEQSFTRGGIICRVNEGIAFHPPQPKPAYRMI